MPAKRLFGRVAVVSGAHNGLGFGLVRALCKVFDGTVYMTSKSRLRSMDALRQLRSEGLPVKFYELDIDDIDSVESLRNYMLQGFNGIDVLINNSTFKGPPDMQFSQEASLTLQTNFFNTVRTCTTLLPIMKSMGRVVNVSSQASLNTYAACSRYIQNRFRSDDITLEELSTHMSDFVFYAQRGTHKKKGFPSDAYGLSKLGVNVATRILSKDLAAEWNRDRTNILINSCCPGMVKTYYKFDPKTVDKGVATPMYLAMLPEHAEEPQGEFVQNGKIVPWYNIQGWQYR